jgi:putative ABC transport system permease protein
MSILETFRTALESLTANKLRTMLTMLGVVIGVASVVALLSIGAGVSANITGRIQGIGSNLITVSPDNRVASARLTTSDVTALQDPLALPEAKQVLAEVRGNAVVAAATNTNNRNTSVLGEDPAFFTMRAIQMSGGDIFTDNDVLLRSRVAVIGSAVETTLYPNGGSALGQTILIGSVPFKVVGVAASVGGVGPNNTDDNVYVPITVAEEKLFVTRSTGLKSVSSVYIAVDSTGDIQSAMDGMSAILRKNHNLLPGQADDFRVFNQAQIASTLDSVSQALTSFLGAIGGIALLVGGIGIMNIMLVSVTERTREIGVRKAIGAKRGAILLQFLTEALTVSSLAGVIGILVGIGASDIIGTVQTTLKPTVQPASVIISFSFSVLIGVIFGLYPAWRASQLQPVEALRYE